jgi:hypothetical protein
MPATKSRCDSNRSRCASSLMRSAPIRRSIAVILCSNSNNNSSNSRCHSGIRCRTCRNSLVNSPRVRFHFPPTSESVLLRDSVLHRLWLCFGIRLAACTVLTVMLLPSCSWQTHVQLPRVESESQSSRFRSAEVRRIFAPLSTHSFTYTSTSYRNTPNQSSSSGTGTSIGTGYAAQPPSPGLDRHAQQAYYAPRVTPNPQPGTFNNDDFES